MAREVPEGLAPGYRACTVCERIKPERTPEGELLFKRRKNRHGNYYITNQCIECVREGSRKTYHKNPARAKAQAREWKRTEKGKQAAREYQQRPEVKARMAEARKKTANARNEYMRDYYRRNKQAILAKNNARRRKKSMELRADIPIHLFRPVLLEILKRVDQAILAERSGVSESVIEKIAYKNSTTRAPLDNVDAILTVAGGEWTTAHLTDMAREWALLTDAPWPEEYLPKGRRYRELRSSGQLRTAQKRDLAKAAGQVAA